MTGLAAPLAVLAVALSAATAIDLADARPEETVALVERPPAPASQCADGIDNDGDGAIDVADPGCIGSADADESRVLQPPPHAPPAGTAAGRVNFAKPHESSMDSHLARSEARPTLQAWWKAHYDRMRYYGQRRIRANAGWLPPGWAYSNAYAVYRQSSGLPPADQDQYVLRDAKGNRLYIPFDCNGRHCTQFAGNVCDPEWRAAWTANAEELAEVYGGVFMDDANIERLVGDASGTRLTPVDYRDGTPLTKAEWGDCMATFIEQAQAAIEPYELVGNTVYFHAGGFANPTVRRAVRAMDLWEVERGFNDPGIVDGTGAFGFETLLAAVDYAHSQGVGVVLDVQAPAGEEYARATYFLISTGRDYVGGPRSSPATWWPGWDVELGAPVGDRALRGDGVWERFFERGAVYVNPPGNGVRTGPWGTMGPADGRVVAGGP